MGQNRRRFVDVVDEIIQINAQIARVWSDVYGWAPRENADLLSKARLDRQVALSRTLKIGLRRDHDGSDEGRLILAWTNLGSLVEGTMKFFLCVFAHDYAKDYMNVGATKQHPEPDPLMLESLKQFFCQKAWTDDDRKAWLPLVDLVQQRRNAIHAFKDRPLGDRREFRKAVRKYRDFLQDVNGTVPYPEIEYDS
ncbi:MAG TPA: hypothetical protein VGI81_07060 [Tepidisphaeraceae bacterium]|jgi:hypothetical protein